MKGKGKNLNCKNLTVCGSWLIGILGGEIFGDALCRDSTGGRGLSIHEVKHKPILREYSPALRGLLKPYSPALRDYFVILTLSSSVLEGARIKVP